MSYNGSGTFQINSTGQPVVSGTVISSTAFNALTADLATGLSTAITKDGQTATTARIPFVAGLNSALVTDTTSGSTGSIFTAGGVGIAKAVYVGTTATVAGTTDSSSTTTGAIITAGGVGVAKALFVGTTANVAGAVTLQSTLGVTGITTFSAQPIFSSLTASSAVATDASKGLVSVTNTGTGNNVLATSPTLVTPALGTPTALVGTNITGTATAFNINGTVGATTATTGAFTTLSASGVTTVQAGSAAAPAITTTGDTNTGIFFPAADTIAFAEGGVESMRINSSGNVGVGTTTPNAKLDINEAVTSTIGDSLGLNIQNNDSRNVGELFQIGMGNNSPSKPMTVIGTVVTNSGFYGRGDIFFATRSVTTDTAPLERMRIDSSGNLLVGTTSQINTGLICAQGSLNSVNTLVCKNTVAQGSGQAFAFFANSAGNKAGSIDHTGTTTVAYTTSSDYRMKENIAPMTGALAAVSQLKPCTYTWKEDGKAGQGFIAHELQAVVPDCVSGEKDAVGEEQYEVTPAVKDEEGRIVTEAVMGTRTVPSYQGIDTSFLVATLTAAIQEQQALITALTTRITALEAA
jgi:hypothetical protein